MKNIIYIVLRDILEALEELKLRKLTIQYPAIV